MLRFSRHSKPFTVRERVDVHRVLPNRRGALNRCPSVSGAQVKNLRSGVSRVAVCTLGDLYCHLQRAMDQEVEATARALLHKAAESNAFIRQDVDAALGHMARHCTPARCINVLLVGGLR